ncbi:MAG: hypothetical protein GY810_11145 [Aureispira sp.]|nr:hypothetical protein [Aureispira sp.]
MENTPLDFFESSDTKQPPVKGCAMGCMIVLPFIFAVWSGTYLFLEWLEGTAAINALAFTVFMCMAITLFMLGIIPSTIEKLVFQKWMKQASSVGRMVFLIFLFYSLIGCWGLLQYIDFKLF